MTCAKVEVRSLLQGASGRFYQGSNRCERPQKTCPRLPGEDYEKCHTICKQECHAEVDAIQQAGEDARGGTMWVGYHYVCDKCKALCDAMDVQVQLMPAKVMP